MRGRAVAAGAPDPPQSCRFTLSPLVQQFSSAPSPLGLFAKGARPDRLSAGKIASGGPARTTGGSMKTDSVFGVTPVRHFSALGVRCIITLPKIRMIFLSTNKTIMKTSKFKSILLLLTLMLATGADDCFCTWYMGRWLLLD
jgi:hypothetical protein